MKKFLIRVARSCTKPRLNFVDFWFWASVYGAVQEGGAVRWWIVLAAFIVVILMEIFFGHKETEVTCEKVGSISVIAMNGALDPELLRDLIEEDMNNDVRQQGAS